MNKEEKYRLGEYLITVSESGQVEWQAHAPLAMERRGYCFILGNILILGQCRDEDHGYLIMEFHDHLRKLPPWTKTVFYCSSVNLLDITGRVVTEEFLLKMTMLARIKGAAADSASIAKRGAFKIGWYIINVADDGRISWQTIEGLNKITGGQCRIESNILFICPPEYVQEHQNKQDFIEKMNLLPQWSYSIAWCKSMVLEECRPGQTARQHRAVPSAEDLRQKFIRGRNFFENHRAKSRKEASRMLLLSAYKRLPSLWPRFSWAKAFFKRLIPAVFGASVLLVGLILIFYTVAKGCHHRDNDHHHKHEHEED